MTDTKALADRIEQDQGTWEDIAEAARILRDVVPYVQHRPGCPHHPIITGGLEGPCTCGLQAALDALEKE